MSILELVRRCQELVQDKPGAGIYLVCILFPELEKLVPTLHRNSVYELLYEFPGAKHVANAHLTRLSNLVEKASKGHYTKKRLPLLEILPEHP